MYSSIYILPYLSDSLVSANCFINFNSFGNLNAVKKWESNTDLSLGESYVFLRIGLMTEPRC